MVTTHIRVPATELGLNKPRGFDEAKLQLILKDGTRVNAENLRMGTATPDVVVGPYYAKQIVRIETSFTVDDYALNVIASSEATDAKVTIPDLGTFISKIDKGDGLGFAQGAACVLHQSRAQASGEELDTKAITQRKKGHTHNVNVTLGYHTLQKATVCAGASTGRLGGGFYGDLCFAPVTTGVTSSVGGYRRIAPYALPDRHQIRVGGGAKLHLIFPRAKRVQQDGNVAFELGIKVDYHFFFTKRLALTAQLEAGPLVDLVGDNIVPAVQLSFGASI